MAARFNWDNPKKEDKKRLMPSIATVGSSGGPGGSGGIGSGFLLEVRRGTEGGRACTEACGLWVWV